MARLNARSRNLSRSIYFYEIQDRYTDMPVQPAQLQRLVGDIRLVSQSQNAYMNLDNGDVARIWVEPVARFPFRLKFGVTRRTGLPPTERAGILNDLRLQPDEGLSELVHCVVFSNSVLGFEFNSYGPRPSRMANYLSDKTEHQVKFVSLIRQNAAETLARYDSLSNVHIKVRSNVIDEVRQANETVGALLANIAEYNGIGNIELRIGTRPRSDDILDGRILRGIRAMFARFNLWEDVKKFSLKGTELETGRDVELDLLSEHIISKQQVVRVGDRSRAVQSESAYLAIERASNELGDEINRALGR